MDCPLAQGPRCAPLDLQVPAEPRLQRRYQALVASHLSQAQSLAAGIRFPPGLAGGFAATQAAWRFFANPRLSLQDLAQPLMACARQEVPRACQRHLLVALDWCNLHLSQQRCREDRTKLTQRQDLGYELLTALALSDRGGEPLAPLCLELKAADGLHSTRSATPLPPGAHLDGLAPVMRQIQKLALDLPAVFIIDREADSIAHLRAWEAAGVQYLVRADAQPRVVHDLKQQPLGAVAEALRQKNRLHRCGPVRFQEGCATQWVGEATVVITRPARTHRADPQTGKTRHHNIAGAPLRLRLVVSELRNEQGTVLARWLLLTNLPQSVAAEQVALWYYWRWRIESYHKLLKSAGQQVEHWQQETAAAFARRLLVGAMAAVVVWRLARETSPAAEQLQQVLVRLSGRQIKRGRNARRFTEPALMAGLGVLLPMLELLQEHDPAQLHALLEAALPGLLPPPRQPVPRSRSDDDV